jgi:hypothetical protein
MLPHYCLTNSIRIMFMSFISFVNQIFYFLVTKKYVHLSDIRVLKL